MVLVRQSATMHRSHSDRKREPRLALRPSSSILTLLAIRCRRPYWMRRSQPIQSSRAAHLSAADEKAASATQSPSPKSPACQMLSPILGPAPR